MLRALEHESTGLSLGQIAQRVGLARSTVQRIVAALETEKLVIAASPNGRVRLGPTILRLAGSVRTVVCAGTRAPEMALRLKYAGWSEDAIEVVPEIGPSLDRAVGGANGRLFALPTYTALLELRTLLTQRGLARDYWE